MDVCKKGVSDKILAVYHWSRTFAALLSEDEVGTAQFGLKIWFPTFAKIPHISSLYVPVE